MGDVIDFFSKKVLKEKTRFVEPEKITTPFSPNFEDAMVRNKNNLDRLRKEREQANKNVIKNYKIK